MNKHDHDRKVRNEVGSDTTKDGVMISFYLWCYGIQRLKV